MGDLAGGMRSCVNGWIGIWVGGLGGGGGWLGGGGRVHFFLWIGLRWGWVGGEMDEMPNVLGKSRENLDTVEHGETTQMPRHSLRCHSVAFFSRR